MLYVMFYVVVSCDVRSSGIEHNNDRLNTTGLGPIGPTPPATHNDVR